MDLKRLTHLLALADECHFARAAERVHLSQPAFSRSIQWLEREVGMPLFDRGAGEVKPTPAGSFLIERARHLLFDARSLKRDIGLYRDGQLGDIAFGAGPVANGSLMPRVVAELRRRHPGVGLRLECSNWQQLYERLLAEDIEFYVGEVRDLPEDIRVVHAPLGRQLGSLFARAGHPLAGRPCTLREAWRYGVAATRMPLVLQAVISQLLGRPRGAPLDLALECNDLALLRWLAQSTDTLVALTGAALRDDLAAGLVVPLEVGDLPPLYVEMAIMTLANRSSSPMAERAIACVREQAEALGM